MPAPAHAVCPRPPTPPCRSVIVVLTGLLVQLYFGGSLPRSPYPTPEQQAQRAAQQAQRAQRARSRSSGRVSPEDSAALQESPLRSQYPPAAIVATSPARP